MLNKNLRTLRKQKGLTQEGLAAQLHVARQTISKWESGVSVPDADTLLQMAEILEVDVCELLGDVNISEKEKPDIVRELEHINQQMAERNRRVKRIWKMIMILGIAVILWGAIGAGIGILNYYTILNDTAYSAETANMILSNSISMVTKGGIRVVVGMIITLVSLHMRKG